MKQQVTRFVPFVALMILGVIGMPKMASTAPRMAEHDFCGHRAEAVERTDQALRQLQAAMQCDRH